MVFHKPDFCRGVAMVLRGESLKAGSYVNHRASLGGLREKIVRRLIRDQTPSRFHVQTGLIHCQPTQSTSRQCDILIHESASRAPLYRWEDFVVVHRGEARAVVEVKSVLNEQTFDELLSVHGSLVEMAAATGPSYDFTPTFGFALSGVTFPTFVEYLQSAVRCNRLNESADARCLNWPVCIAVQDRNYVAVRPLQQMRDSGCRIGCCAIDFTKLQGPVDERIDGIETGHFIEIYNAVLREPPFPLFAENLYSWFNRLPIEEGGKVWVTPDGETHHGDIEW